MRQALTGIDRLYTCGRSDRVIDDAHIVIENDRIVAVGQGALSGHFDAVEDLSGCIAMPGLINLHHHFFQTLTRAVPGALRGHLIDWLGMMYPIWSGMTPDDLAAATQASIAQLLLTGSTTSVDHSYLLPGGGTDFVASEIEAASAMGARLHFIRGSMTAMEADLESRLTPLLGPRAGGLVDDAGAVLADMTHTLDRYHETGWGASTTIGLGPTTTTFDTIDFMRAVAELSQATNCNLHIHFHPRPDERAWCAQNDTTPLDVLERAGWLTPRTFLAHGTRLERSEMDRCAQAGVAIAHCPRMILRLGARVTPVHDMLEAGMRAGIGVDGGASNDSGSMLGELRIAQLLHRVAGGEGEVPWQKWLSPYRLLCMATRDAAAILGRSDIGHIAPGMCADITAFRMGGAAYAGARSEPLSGLLMAGDDDRAWLTMVKGKTLVRNRTLCDMDEDAIGRRTDHATARLLDRASALTGLDYTRFH